MSETIFDLEHNLTEYNQLVGAKYADAPVLEGYAIPSGSTRVAAPKDLERYVETAPKSTTFRPKIFDTNIEEIDFKTFGLPLKREDVPAAAAPMSAPARTSVFNFIESRPRTAPVVEAAPAPGLELVAEVEVEPAVAEAAMEQDESVASVFKLNAVGMVAVLAFIAVTLLIITFIITNSITIRDARLRIANLASENSVIAAELEVKQGETALLYEERAKAAEEIVFAEGSGYAPVEVLESPAGDWTPPAETRARLGFFDRIARFFNKLFKG